MLASRHAVAASLLLLSTSVGAQPAWEDGFADWSPDGTQIAFASSRSGSFQIWIMNADGSDARRLTHSDAADISPSWAPDGNALAFVSNRDGNMEIYRVDARGGEAVRVTETAGNEAAPDWSPDGEWLVFAYSDDPDPAAIGQSGRLVTARPDGSDRAARLTEGVQAYPRWSPDGTRLTFSGRLPGEEGYGVYAMPSADGFPRRVSGEGAAFNSFWTPDGEHLVFVSPREGTAGIYEVDVSGGAPRRVTDNEVGWFQPRVSPDGTKILVRIGFGAAHQGIAVIGRDGSGAKLLTDPANSTPQTP